MYLRSFIIGSSAFASVPWMWSQALLRKEKNKVNYDYYTWSWQMPIRHGLWNIVSLIIAEYFNLSLRTRFIVITFLDWIITILSVKALDKFGYVEFLGERGNGPYNYNDKEWNEYYRTLLIKQIIWWNVIIYNLEKYV